MNACIDKWLADHREECWALADDIFNAPELGLEEHKTADYMVAFLKKHGFTVEEGIAGMDTAFKATWGSGKPVLGYLAEYDALPGLGQAPVPYRQPIDGPGHGCGHNLLGAGCAVSAAALKAVMEEEGLPGTVVVFGCPAEEILVGKVVMTDAGCFDDVDVAIAWHPIGDNKVSEEGHQAMDSKIFRFYGTTAHAAANPHMGRSALDACELMNVGVNYLREHVPDHVRMHYAYDAAGTKPNIVPDFAQTSYYIRARDRGTVNDVSARVDEIAKGAAMMTGTRVEIELLTGCDDTLINRPLCDLFYDALLRSRAPRYTPEEYAFAEELRKNNGGGTGSAIREGVEPMFGCTQHVFGSTDVANVSRRVPTVTITTACTFYGSPGHHWAVTAMAGMSVGYKGMVYAAQAMAEGARDLILQPKVIEDAWADFRASTAK
ncbi:MAG: amidohydrolase [Christensenellaceae bacterium]|nr:amidohydrolase [Christensenellaceae bacterium]